MSTSTTNVCPLCGMPSENFRRDLRLGQTEVECARCGTFAFDVDTVFPSERHLLSYVCRTWPDGTPFITNENAGALLQRAPLRTIPEKRDWLLQLLARSTDLVGAVSSFDASTDYPLITARNQGEVIYLMDALENVGLIGRVAKSTGILKMAGWERVSQLRQEGPNSVLAFVAMSFSADLGPLFDHAIAPAIREVGYEPFRVDRKEHTNSIDDEIIGSIRKSRFMVADFTQNRSGVYFEAGMMSGLFRTVIWMCKKEELGAVHFDIRQRNFIDWESFEDARRRLAFRIRAIEGEGPNLLPKP